MSLLSLKFSLKSPTITVGISDGRVERNVSKNVSKLSKLKDGDRYTVDKERIPCHGNVTSTVITSSLPLEKVCLCRGCIDVGVVIKTPPFVFSVFLSQRNTV